MANRFVAGIVGLVGVLVLFPTGNAVAQVTAGGFGQPLTPPPLIPFVVGNGTPGTVPIWTGPAVLGDSHIVDGTTVTVNVPLQVTGTVTMDGGGGNKGVAGDGATGTGIYGTGQSVGVKGTGPIGVYGISVSGQGVRGQSSDSVGVQGVSHNGSGVYGSTDSATNNAIVGQVLSTNPTGAVGVIGECPATQGYCNGVIGQTSTNGIGVIGILNAPAAGSAVHGYAFATSGPANGIVGETYSPDAAGVIGLNNSAGGQGVRGGTSSVGGIGVLGYSTATGGIAGQFQGNVFVVAGYDTATQQFYPGNLTVYANAYKPGGGSWTDISDVRLKKSIEPINGALRRLLQLRGVTYEYTNPSAFHELPGTHIGMVAQEVEQVFPTWVDTGDDGYKRLTFRGFEAVAVEAVRELDAKVATNSSEAMARITDLERQNAELRHAVETLSEIVKTLQQK